MKQALSGGLSSIGFQLVAAAALLCAAPQDEEVRKGLAPQWNTVQTEVSTQSVVVRELSRPYPEPKAEPGAPVTALSAEQAKAIADAFVAAQTRHFLEPLGLEAAAAESLFVKETIATVNRGKYAHRGTDYTTVYGQQYRNIPVFEGSMRLNITAQGEVWSAINRLAALNPEIPVKPRLTETAVLDRARDLFGDPAAQPEAGAQLVVFPPAHLAWRLNFLAPHFKEMLIDAISGEVLLQRKNVRD
jgi:hypothetical protein